MNVIVLCCSGFRYDHVGFLGRRQVLTPNLDRLASESAFFEEFWIGSLPAVATRFDVFTGRWAFPFFDDVLPLQYPVLAEVLRERGVATAWIADNPCVAKPGHGLERGFDFMKFVPGQADDDFQPPSTQMIELPCPSAKTEDGGQRLDQYRRNAFWYRQQGTTPMAALFGEAMQWLETPRERFFLWMDAFDPHAPWDAPEKFLKHYPLDKSGDAVFWPKTGSAESYSKADLANVESLYKAEVTHADYWLGQLLQYLERQRLLEKTVLIFLGDQGCYLGERNLIGAAQSNRPEVILEPLAHPPLMLRHPGGLAAGQLLPGLAQPLDLFPTVLELMGVPAVPWIQGHSLVRRLSGGPAMRSFAVSGCHPRKEDARRLTVCSKEWCFVHSPQGGMANSELYRRGTDSGEVRNVIAEFPDVAGHHHQWLRSWMDENDVPGTRRQQLLEGTGFTWLNDLQQKLWLKQIEKNYRSKYQKAE